jgi:hypothetical protein
LKFCNFFERKVFGEDKKKAGTGGDEVGERESEEKTEGRGEKSREKRGMRKGITNLERERDGGGLETVGNGGGGSALVKERLGRGARAK